MLQAIFMSIVLLQKEKRKKKKKKKKKKKRKEKKKRKRKKEKINKSLLFYKDYLWDLAQLLTGKMF